MLQTPRQIKNKKKAGGQLADELTATRRRDTGPEKPAISHKQAKDVQGILHLHDDYREIFDKTNDAFFIHNAKTGNILDVNEKTCEMSGRTREEVRGKLSISAISADMPPYTQKEVLEWIRKASHDGPQLFEWQARHKDGTVFWVEVNLKRARIGNKDRILAVVRDITKHKTMEEELKKHRDHLDTLVAERTAQLRQEIVKRKKTEEQYRALLESIEEWVWEADADFVHTYVSPRVYNVLGYKPEELIGKRPTEIMPPEEVKRTAPLIKKIFSQKKPFVAFFNKCLHKDGRTIFLEINGFPFFDQAGKLLGYRGSGHDITKQKKILGALKERERELTMKSRTLEEVNTALRVMLKQREEDRKELEEQFMSNIREMILSHVNKIQKGHLDPAHRAYLNVIETNLKEIMSPYLNTIRQFNFTPREIEVASLIRNGKTTKEIAEIMGVATSAIDSHRNNIRNKIGLNNKKANLRSYLLSLR
jgi:PAS domain S-box-containing protein